MKIIEGGENIAKELNKKQLTILKNLMNLKIEEYFPDSNSNSGFMIFDGLSKIFGHDRMYVEFFFNKESSSVGSGKLILYDGDEPDEVLDAMCIINEICGGFTKCNTDNDIRIVP
jgi:hypothetical protein